MANFGGTTQRDTEVRLPRATRVRPDFGVYTGQIYRGHVCTPVYTRTRMLYASVHPNPSASHVYTIKTIENSKYFYNSLITALLPQRSPLRTVTFP